MSTVITTRYKCRPGSNVGAHVATAAGRQRSVIDQSISDPHRAAADALAAVLGLVVVEQIDATSDGQGRRFSTAAAS